MEYLTIPDAEGGEKPQPRNFTSRSSKPRALIVPDRHDSTQRIGGHSTLAARGQAGIFFALAVPRLLILGAGGRGKRRSGVGRAMLFVLLVGFSLVSFNGCGSSGGGGTPGGHVYGNGSGSGNGDGHSVRPVTLDNPYAGGEVNGNLNAVQTISTFASSGKRMKLYWVGHRVRTIVVGNRRGC